MESEADPGWGGLYESDIFFEIILTKFIKIDMMVLTSKRKEDVEHDHHQRDGLRAAHFAGADGRGEAFGGRDVGNGIDPQSVCLPDSAQALRRQFGAGAAALSAAASCPAIWTRPPSTISWGSWGERGILCACMEPGYECRWQDKHGRCTIHCQLAALQQKQDEAFRAVSLRRLLTGGPDPQDTSKL